MGPARRPERDLSSRRGVRNLDAADSTGADVVAALRLIKAVSEVRSWAQERDGWPVRRLDGRVALGFSGDVCLGVRIGWGEFEVNFCAGRCVLVHDETPGSIRSFVGSESEAERFVAGLAAEDAARASLAQARV